MAYPVPGTQTGIAFGTSGFTAFVRDVGGPSIARAVIDMTHNGSATVASTGSTSDNYTQVYREKKPGIVDMGEITLDLVNDPDLQPPLNEPNEIITLTFPLPTGTATVAAAWAVDGFMSGYELTTPYENEMTARMTLALSGVPTFTASS